MATGAKVKITVDPPVIDPFKRNPPLEEAVRANLEALDLGIDADDGKRGSSDIGNLSQHIPCIHAYLAIVGYDTPTHSTAFAQATDTDRGQKAMLNAAKMLAMTAYDYLTSASLREKAALTHNKPPREPYTKNRCT